MIRIERAGFASVQDLGRRGAARWGVPRGGAFDEWALRVGNRLCGNDDAAAGIEFVLAGPSLIFERAVRFALTGAPFAATLDGEPVEPWRTIAAPAGARLTVGKAAGGARGMLCVAGGIDTPPVLQSRSVSARAGIGAPCADGDRLPVGSAAAAPFRRARDLAPAAALRVVPGPQRFAGGALDAMCGAPFTVSTQADRVGVRLDGPRPAHGPGGPEIDPEPAIPGAVQVPGDGRPIVLGPDGPATGGYPKIAVVIAADLWMLARARPGDRLRFERCDPAVARRAAADRMREIDDAIHDEPSPT